MPPHDADPVTMEVPQLSLFVKHASAEELDGLVHGERGPELLERLAVGMPGVFRPDRAAGTEAVVHWALRDLGPDGAVYEVVITHGTCAVSPVPARRPTLTLSIGAVDYLKMVTGNANPVLMFMRGRIRAKGDRMLATKFPGLFDIPKA
ncbi:SCP2 sterol-binding domain-containing protein [Dactylosporangium sp. NPDC051485]|uniref:SCP2 sterol-binding domain-containing protein n=1 Tax=Dactylosporangium sp. NPDC051485 TaxID=3154846 RepID=UPI00342549BA